MKHYDVIIIWSGWGTKLRALADYGKTVAIIEKSELGGTCLNRGCIPSKMLIYPSDLMTHAREDASKLHISWLENPRINFEKLVEDTNAQIQTDSQSIEPIYQNHENITLYKWHGKFIENKTIEVNWEKISGENIYIATGSVPQIPNIAGLEGTPYMTSKQALKNTKLPKKMIVIGGGYIAVELWHVYAAAWCDVHFLVRSGMIKAEDTDIREAFQEDFAKRYSVHFWVSPVKIEYKNKTFFVRLDTWEIMQSDALFVATGVVPMTEWLWLENTDIRTSKKWYIEVDEFLETQVPWVFSLWDVVGNYLFRHSVNFEGEYLVEEYKKAISAQEHKLLPESSDYKLSLNSLPFQGKEATMWSVEPLALEKISERTSAATISKLERSSKDSGKSLQLKYPPMPHAIFTYPQIAGVWVTEDELEKSWKIEWQDYEVAIHHYKNSAMWSAMKAELGFVKLIAEKSSWKLIWAHIIGEKAAEMIHMLIVMITAEMTVSFMIEKMIFIHPALPEVIRNAARSLVKKI